MNKLVLIILAIGIIYRLALTWNGNFLFNMDNGRDMVDVRELVEVGKLRLTGPTSAIEGFYNGPAWYYLLAVPYAISGGDPYSAILMEITLWAIGGFFLLKIVSLWGKHLVLPVGALWVSSDYIVLTNLYAFNPNPVTLLTPFFIYLLYKFLKTEKLKFSILTFFLGGLFFNFEMNFGIFVIPIVLASIFLTRKFYFIKNGNFWIGFLFFILCILPQILFDLRHNFIMTKSVINYLSSNPAASYGFAQRLQLITKSFFDVFSATLMNHKTFSLIVLALSIPIFIRFLKEKDKKLIALICLSIIFVPFILYLFIPVSVNPWHLGGFAAAAVLFTGWIIHRTWNFNFFGKIIAVFVTTLLVFFALSNIFKFFTRDFGRPSMDPSLYKNEISAIDYVYKYADGKNFKVYAYLPSVYDYPYQYLFWWYGKKNYGYIPGEYAYSPNKPQYISNKDKFEGRKDNFSGLVFLIKEPDRIKMRQAWENDYKNMEFILKEIVGPLEVEVRFEK